MKDETTLYKTKLAFMTPPYPAELIDGEVRFSDGFDEDFVRNRLRGQLSGYLWGEPGPTQTIKYPATWWDAFKLRWFPARLLARYPAVYQCHEINLNTLYPLFRISLEKETSVLKFSVRDYKYRSADEEAQKAVDSAEPDGV